jgi:NAD(P)-dependent dehydrogenase (short-subunit alcohol dehydrogenase family)
LQKLPGDLSLRSDAQNLQVSDLHVGQRVTATYNAGQSQLETLCARAGLNGRWATAPEISVLLWASYFVGMELPGKRALFSTLRIEFPANAIAGTPFQYQAEIERISDMGELSMRAELSSEGQKWAVVKIGAYVRQDVPPATTEKIHSLIGSSEALVGKVAVVTGASRGLGACMVRALALHGCTVVMNFLSSGSEAEQVRSSVAQTSGKIVFEQGDVGDVRWCIELQQRMGTGLNRLDFLICNASPSLLPLWLQPTAAVRMNQFLAKSLAMVSAPTAALMPLVADSNGWCVMISSTAVTQIHPHFPHYAAAKSAAEAITQAAVAEYRTVSGMIVRPARLLTDLTNTPLGRKGALAPELVAVSVVRRLLGMAHPGKIEVLDDFSST